MKKISAITVSISLILLSALTAISVAPTQPANAVVISPFTASYNTQVNGGVVFAQNNSLSCDGVKADGSIDVQACNNTKAGSKTLPTNNGWRMNHVDIDSDPTTFN